MAGDTVDQYQLGKIWNAEKVIEKLTKIQYIEIPAVQALLGDKKASSSEKPKMSAEVAKLQAELPDETPKYEIQATSEKNQENQMKLNKMELAKSKLELHLRGDGKAACSSAA